MSEKTLILTLYGVELAGVSVLAWGLWWLWRYWWA